MSGTLLWKELQIFFWCLVLLSAWTGARASEPDTCQAVDWKERLEMLRAAPYVDVGDVWTDSTEVDVVFHDPELASLGCNIYCTKYSGETFLMDMSGEVVHRWSYKDYGGVGSYHHSCMLPNGDLLIIKEHKDLLKVTWNSESVWKIKLQAHHDLAITPQGHLYVLARKLEEHRGLKVWFDEIVHLTAQGHELGRWSTFDALPKLQQAMNTDSFLDTILDSIETGWTPEDELLRPVAKAFDMPRAHKVDYFHMNTINLLPENAAARSDPRFQKGNLLVCFRNVNQIAVLDRVSYEVLWAWGEGQLERPHHPTMQPDGHILIFDNGVHRYYSRVIEIDPLTEEIVWEYKANPTIEFYSFGRGSAQRLPNGNTLICESDRGRVFEITPEKELAWAWLNPSFRRDHREGIYRMMRLPENRVEALLREHKFRGRPQSDEVLEGAME